jgi:hypothetical protein
MLIICKCCKSKQDLTSDNIVGQQKIEIEFSRSYDINEIQIMCKNCGQSILQVY